MTREYVPRLADRVLAEIVEAHPAVLIVGPRSTGKTTSGLRKASSTLRLTEGRVAEALRSDPATVLSGRSEPILIDEWQIVPECLNAVKDRVDTVDRRGQFILTGSVRGDLDSDMWPGTGRLIRVAMYGLTEREIARQTESPTWLDSIVSGNRFEGFWSEENTRTYLARALRSGFPEPTLRLDETGRQRWLASYVDQLVTRDAAAVDHGRDPQRLRRYLEALALNSAGIVDDTTLWEAARINRATARAYDSLLQNLLVVENVPAWTTNRLKRLSLAPKRYLVDSGLFAGVLGVSVDDVLIDGDLTGKVLDTFVTAQLRAELALTVPQRRLSHLRLPQGRHEIDLIVELGPNNLAAVEIKATSAPRHDDVKHLAWLRAQMGDSLKAAVLLHTGPAPIDFGDGILGLPIATLWSNPEHR